MGPDKMGKISNSPGFFSNITKRGQGEEGNQSKKQMCWLSSGAAD